MPTQEQLQIRNLGERRIPSPLNLSTVPGDQISDYVPDEARVLLHCEAPEGQPVDAARRFEKAGPRQWIHFDPALTKAGIVSCGGLCPGINNVIRSMVLELHHKYGVRKVLGYRYGYRGLNPASAIEPIPLGPAEVRAIHREGGTMLGSSRGAQDVQVMVDTLVRDGVQLLFTIGGDGTLTGAHAIHEEIVRRGLPIAVVGVPKTVDNDVNFMDRTFGFDTAVEVARMALDAAHTEAAGALNGVGLVKVMGRDSGFIAAYATLASVEVNYCLVPEVTFEMQGPNGLLATVTRRLQDRHHALIVVAEGCAAALADPDAERDASGNLRYASADLDIGPHLRDALLAHFKSVGLHSTVKYIDPSYMIRSVPANASDSIFCDMLARHAVHAGMAGKTDLVIGHWNGLFTHVPLLLATRERKKIDPDGGLWLAVMETTGQPSLTNAPR